MKMIKKTKNKLLYKLVTVVLIAFVACVCWAFVHTSPESKETDREKLLYTVGQLLEKNHFSGKKIDDVFSAQVFDAELKDIDPDKDIFLQSDINKLKEYRAYIDDEIHGAPMKFYPTLEDLYNKSIASLNVTCKDILSKPFDFSANESINLNEDTKAYPASETARKDAWRKKIKYMVLERYADLLEQKKKNPTDTTYAKPDSELEKTARDRVSRIITKNFDKLTRRTKGNDGFNDFVNVIAETMDPHTNYMAPVEKRSFDEDLSGKFYGIGAQLKEEEGQVKIASVIPGSPAFKTGEVQANDVIVKVSNNGVETDLTGAAVEDAIKVIRGTKGSTVIITFKKTDGTTKVVRIVREEIILDEKYARSAIVNENGKRIGYIYLPEFYANLNDADGARCSIDVAKELLKLKAEKVDGVIIDLRFNGGGFLYEVVNMVGLFIEDGPVVQVKDKTGKASVLSDRDKGVLYDGPVAVMVNELSASASEIFAAAIQDYKRGIVVGSSSTFGKGTVQRPLPVGEPVDMMTGETPYGSLKITQQKFYRINGGSTQLKGVVPDVVLPDTYETLKIREKDAKSALAWDVIPQAPYKPWADSGDFAALEKEATAKADTAKAFQVIRKNTAWLEKNSNKEVSLNLAKYQQKQEEIKKVVKETTDNAKLSAELNITSLDADKAKFVNNPDTLKQERYQQWLKGLRSDIYIKATADLVAEMAKGGSTVKN
jgi:carboxyl-terminal processing protease